jgi:hypothetical protein
VLGDEYKNYRDPVTGQTLPAVHLRAVVNGRTASVWRRREEVLRWYVRTDEEAANCVWIVKTDPMSSTSHEVAANEPLNWTANGRWRTSRKLD